MNGEKQVVVEGESVVPDQVTSLHKMIKHLTVWFVNMSLCSFRTSMANILPWVVRPSLKNSDRDRNFGTLSVKLSFSGFYIDVSH